jgi:uroporphyrinogen decarboxylase
MRQAGRYMKAYQEIRARYPLMEMFRTPGLAAEVTLQPVRAFPIDAAIIFADILLPLEGMGIGFEFVESRGPVIARPVRSAADIEALRVADPEEDLGYVLEAVRQVRAEIDGKVPLIGFAGAPFTLAGYAIEGGGAPNHLLTKRVMYEQPEAWNLLMDKMVRTLVPFLKAQVRAGAQVVQLFDSWVGCLDPSDYARHVLPHTRRIFRELRGGCGYVSVVGWGGGGGGGGGGGRREV